MLTDKQLLFRDYLVKRLGFVEDNFLPNYLEHLRLSAQKFRYLGALPAIYEEVISEYGERMMSLKNKDKFKDYERKGDIAIPLIFSIFDFLNLEFKVKRNRALKLVGKNSLAISATDIANFTFCPVSYSISKTFAPLKVEATHYGIDLHEQNRLNALGNVLEENIRTFEPDFPSSFINTKNKAFFDELRKSEIIYSGHGEKRNSRYFKSKLGNFLGQPDYIYKNTDTKKYFVVEEKFQFDSGNFYSEEDGKFFSNHKNQLSSYLHGITDYDLEYGYLIYWKYSFHEGEPFVHSCHVYRMCRTEANLLAIRKIYIEIKEFLKSGEMEFKIQDRKPSKCANCVSSIICGHKTGGFKTLKLPYSIQYLKTAYSEFPKELKKDLPDPPLI